MGMWKERVTQAAGTRSRVKDQRIISSRHPRASPAANLLFNSAESPSPSTEHRTAGHPVWGEEPGRRASPLCQWPGAPTAVVAPLLGTLLPVLPSFGLTPASPPLSIVKAASSACLSALSWSLGCPVLVSVLPLLTLLSGNILHKDLPHGPAVKNLPGHAGNTGSIPALGRSHMVQSN